MCQLKALGKWEIFNDFTLTAQSLYRLTYLEIVKSFLSQFHDEILLLLFKTIRWWTIFGSQRKISMNFRRSFLFKMFTILVRSTWNFLYFLHKFQTSLSGKSEREFSELFEKALLMFEEIYLSFWFRSRLLRFVAKRCSFESALSYRLTGIYIK